MTMQAQDTPFANLAEAPLPETPEGTQPDAQAQAPSEVPAGPSVADLQAKISKLENDLKAERGRGKPVDEIRAALSTLRDEVNDRFEEFHRTQASFARAIGTDDPSERTQAIADAEKAQAEFQKRRGALNLSEMRQRFAAEITAALTDEDGNPLLPGNATELQEAIRLFQRGDAANDATLWAQALSETNRVVLRAERAKAAQAAADAEKRGEEKAKAAVRKSANLDNGGLTPAGTPGRRTLEQLAQVNTRGMSLQQLKEFDAEWEAAARR